MSETLKSISYLKDSLNFMGENELRETLTYLLKVYVLDREGQVKEDSVNKNRSFFDIISELKREYRAPELNMFSLESGKVYLNIDNREIEISAGESPSPTVPRPEVESINKEDNGSSEDIEPEGEPQRFRSLEF